MSGRAPHRWPPPRCPPPPESGLPWPEPSLSPCRLTSLPPLPSVRCRRARARPADDDRGQGVHDERRNEEHEPAGEQGRLAFRVVLLNKSRDLVGDGVPAFLKDVRIERERQGREDERHRDGL